MKNTLRLAISTIITASLVWLLLKNIRLSDLVSTLSGINHYYLAIAVAAYFSMMVMRALRFSLLLKGKISFSSMLPVVLVHNLMNNLLPFKMGELSYIYLMKKTGRSSISHGISTLVISRIFDLFSLSAFFISAVIFSGIGEGLGLGKAIPAAIIFILILSSIFFMLVFRQDLIRAILDFCFGRLIPARFSWMNQKAGKILEVFHETKHNLFSAFLLSVMIIISGIIFIFFMILSLGHLLEIGVLIIASGIAMITTSLPIYGIGGFGTIEGAWTIVLSFFGYPVQSAIIVSFSIHIIQLAAATVFGAVGWLGLRKKE